MLGSRRLVNGSAALGLVEIPEGNEMIVLASENPAQLGAPSAPKRFALPVVWEQHKERIQRLYLTKNKPLKEVMAIMKRDYQFTGTVKQFKTHISKWGFDTKYKKHKTTRRKSVKRLTSRSSVTSHPAAGAAAYATAATAVTATTTAPQADQSAQYAARGVQEQVSIHQRPQTIQGEALVLHDLPFLTCDYVAQLQHGYSASPPLSIAERIFSLAQQHVETSFSYGFWKFDGKDVITIGCSKDDLELPESYFDHLRSTVLLFAQGSNIEAGHVLRKAFELIDPILKSGNVRAMNFFWTSIVYLVQCSHESIVVALIKHIENTAKLMLHPSHPIVAMFRLLSCANLQELEALVHNAWQLTTDAFQKQLPDLHPEYIRHQCDLIFRVYGMRDPLAGEQRLNALIEQCELATQVPELSHLTVLNALGYNAMNLQDWAKAANIGKQLDTRAEASKDPDHLVYQLGGLEIQARALNQMKLVPMAVECLDKAIPLIAERWGIDDPWRIELMALQQNWLRADGKIEAADLVKTEIADLVQALSLEEMGAETC